MNILEYLIKREKTSLCIIAGFLALSFFIIFNSNGIVKENTGDSYVIRIKHYGLNAEEIERSITIPLEDALSGITDILSVESISENSLSRVFIRFKKGGKGYYEAVRDAVQRVFETLPPSVQRPEIISSNNSQIPVWSAAVSLTDENDNYSVFDMLEKIVKPRLESLEGTGEVFISGIGKKEIYIVFDQEKLGVLGLDPFYAAEFLAMNDSVFPGGSFSHNGREIAVIADSRYSLSDALIPLEDRRSIKLSEIAIISEQEREPDIISRLNGKKSAGIAVMGKSGSDHKKLSAEINKVISSISLPLNFTVLSDLGAEEAEAFRSVFKAALLGAVMVTIICFFLNGKYSFNITGLLCALTIPLICIISIAVLTIAGFSVNRFLLAGIAAGTGTAVDAVILCSEKLRKCYTVKSASAALYELAGPLTAGTATTIAAFFPLFYFDNNDIKIISGTIIVICIVSLVISLAFLPSLLMHGKTAGNINKSSFIFFAKLSNKISGFIYRLLALNVRLCFRYYYIIIIFGLVLSIAGITKLLYGGIEITGFNSDDSLYGQVEFESGLIAEETDRLLASYSYELLKINGIKNIETGAKTGSGSILISFDPEKIQSEQVREAAKNIYIPGGFVFFHESSSRDRYWEIRINGDDDKKCRELAEELAFLCAGHPLVTERVLNFKSGSKKLVLIPDRELFSELSLNFSNAASRIRLGVFGPVVYKRKHSDGETDVRFKAAGDGNLNISHKTKDEILSILVPAGEDENKTMRIDSLFLVNEDTDSGSIRRTDRRRTASITITTRSMDPRKIKLELKNIFEKLNLPPGYSIEFDPDAIRQAEKILFSYILFITAVVFCYMILASINESFTVPLIILSAVPPSLSVPALVLSLFGFTYNTAVACAFIAVSGMTVNSAVLCVNSIISKNKNQFTIMGIYLALRNKLPALLATSATTVCGALPFIFLKEGSNSLIKTISIVGALGVSFSCLFSITIIPSIFIFSIRIKQIFQTK